MPAEISPSESRSVCPLVCLSPRLVRKLFSCSCLPMVQSGWEAGPYAVTTVPPWRWLLFPSFPKFSFPIETGKRNKHKFILIHTLFLEVQNAHYFASWFFDLIRALNRLLLEVGFTSLFCLRFFTFSAICFHPVCNRLNTLTKSQDFTNFSANTLLSSFKEKSIGGDKREASVSQGRFGRQVDLRGRVD